jgi:hypothetical protein
MRKQPNFTSWATLRPWVKHASRESLRNALWEEQHTFNRPYIKRRLASAMVTKYRAHLRKEFGIR